MSDLRAGSARACITPPLGVRMAGYAGRTDGCEAIHDDLYGKALVLDNGECALALLTLDVIGLDIMQVQAIRAGVEAKTGIPGLQVMVCCSHTHSGPALPSSDPRRDPFATGTPEVPPWVDVMVETLVGVVRQAQDRVQPVQLRFAEGTLADWSQNRRRVAQGGTLIDPDVRALVLTGEREQPLAVVVNYACHPTVMGSKNLVMSAEYPGAMAGLVEAALPGCIVLFVNGACANLNPNWFKLESNAFETVEQMGRALGGEVLRMVYTAIATQDPERDVVLGADSLTEQLPLWPQPEEEEAGVLLEAQKALLEQARSGAFPSNPFPFWHSMTVDENLSVRTAESYVSWAEELVRLAEADILVDTPDAEVQVLRIGRGGIASMPGEIFMELGQRIKETFADRPIFIAGYTNGSVGYIPTKEAFGEKGYEVTVAQRARLIPIAEEGGDTLTEWAIRLLQGLLKGGVG